MGKNAASGEKNFGIQPDPNAAYRHISQLPLVIQSYYSERI